MVNGCIVRTKSEILKCHHYTHLMISVYTAVTMSKPLFSIFRCKFIHKSIKITVRTNNTFFCCYRCFLFFPAKHLFLSPELDIKYGFWIYSSHISKSQFIKWFGSKNCGDKAQNKKISHFNKMSGVLYSKDINNPTTIYPKTIDFLWPWPLKRVVATKTKKVLQ
jgi:hypothetical protein